MIHEFKYACPVKACVKVKKNSSQLISKNRQRLITEMVNSSNKLYNIANPTRVL